MRTARFIVDSVEDNIISFSKAELHHIQNVLQIKPQAEIEVFDKQTSRMLLCKLLADGKAEVLKEVTAETSSKLHLLIGLTKPKIADFITEKAVELALSSVSFFVAERTQEKLKDIDKRLERFQRITEAALKQSGAFTLPKIHIQKSLLEALELVPKDAQNRLIFNPEAKQSILKFKKSLKPSDTYLVIGPEGGFSERELELARKNNFQEVLLGTNTLRSETAMILASALTHLLINEEIADEMP